MTQSIQILLIEDNEDDAFVFVRALKESSAKEFEVFHVDSITPALEMLSQRTFDVIVVDYLLPDADRDHVRVITNHAPETPIILISGVDSEYLGIKVMQDGVSDYLIKNQINAHSLRRALRYAVERKKAADDLRASEAFIRTITDNIPTYIAYCSKDHRLLFMNKSYLARIGKTRENALGKYVKELASPEQFAIHGPKMEQAVNGNGSRFEVEFKRPDGSRGYSWTEYVPHLNRDVVLGYFVVGVDVTEIKERENRIQELNAFTQAIFENSAVAMYVLDADGPCVLANTAACKLSGAPKEVIVGTNFRTLANWKEAGLLDAALKALETNAPTTFSGEMSMLSKQRIFVTANIAPLTLSGKRHLILQGSDISASKRAESELIRTAQLNSLSQLSGGVAHEVNTPLAIIQNCAEQLNDLSDLGKLSSDEMKSLTKTITDAVTRTANIVSSLRAFAKDGSKCQSTPVQVVDLLNATTDLFRAQFERNGIRVILDPVESGLSIQCKQSEISQALLALANNSFDAILGTPSPFIQITARTALPDHVEISVTDSGPGIPQDIVDKIMHPFFTTKDIGMGSGLGLSVALGILKAHHGELSLDRASPHTRFVIKIPKTQKTNGVEAYD